MGFNTNKSKSVNESQQTSNSSNQAYPALQQAFGGVTGQTANASNAIANLLGLGGTGAQDQGFQNFKNNSGYNFIRDEGLSGISGNQAARGLLGSGSTLKAMNKYNNNLADSFLNSYLQQLTGLSNTGLQAGNVISGAGNVSQSQGTSSGTSKGGGFGLQLG